MSRYINQDKVIDAVLNLDTTHRVSWRDAVVDMIDGMPSADVQPDITELIATIKNGISATNTNDVYSCGMRNGMRWVLSLVDGKEPSFESARNAADVQPVVRCSECANNYSTPHNPMCDYMDATLYPDSFCSKGKPKGVDCTDCIKNGGDWECDHIHCHKGVG